MNLNSGKFIVVSGFILILIYIILFPPLYNYGDGTVYLNFAKEIAEKGNTGQYLHRSPLLPWLISLIIKPLGFENTAKVVVVFNFITIFLSGLILFTIIQKYLCSDTIALISTLIFYLDFSVIFYGYVLYTETLTLFLVMLTVRFLLGTLHNSSGWFPLLSGIFASLTVLCRFNILPLLAVFLAGIVLIGYFIYGFGLVPVLKKAGLFILPVFIILNSYSYHNYKTWGFYGVFPAGGSSIVSRNALIATLRGDENVTEQQREVLKIFINARNNFLKEEQAVYKSSLLFPGRKNLINEMAGGFKIYLKALPSLCDYFKIDPKKPEPEISEKLHPFYREIRKINKPHIWKLRALSFAGSFTSSAGLNTPSKPDTHLARLPSGILIVYKLLVPLISFAVLMLSVIYLLRVILGCAAPDGTILFFILIISGFFLINFGFATVIDASRFKYPSEPFIISLGVYWAFNFIKPLYGKKIKSRINSHNN